MTSQPGHSPYLHDAFISYRHDTEGEFAGALEKALEHLAKDRRPGNRFRHEARALDVFLDTSDLTGGADLEGKLATHVGGSRYLILLASPHAADPEEGYWVNRELEYWLTHATPGTEDAPSQEDRLLIALASGDLVWRKDSHTWDPEQTTAAPAALQQLTKEPLFVDFRSPDMKWTLRDDGFKASVARLQAPIRGKRLDQIFGLHLDQERRRRRVLWFGIATFAILLAVVAFFLWLNFELQGTNSQLSGRNEQLALDIDERQQELDLKEDELEVQIAAVETQRALADQAAEEAARQEAAAARQTELADEAGEEAARQTALASAAEAEAETQTELANQATEAAAVAEEEARRQQEEADRQTALADAAAVEAARQQAIADAATSEAELQLTIADAVRLANASADRLAADVDVAALLALEALDTTLLPYGFTTGNAESALYNVRATHWRSTLRADDAELFQGGVRTVTFSPDGTRIVTGGGDGVPKLWDAESGALRAAFEGHLSFSIDSTAFSPNGSRIVTGSGDGTAKVWDADTGALLRSLDGHKPVGVNSAEFSPDGSRIVTGSDDGTAKVWDAETGALLLSLDAQLSSITTLAAFNPNGSQILTTSNKSIGDALEVFDGGAELWDATSGVLLFSLGDPAIGVFSSAFDASGGRLVIGGDGQDATVWQTDSGSLVATLSGHTGRIISAAFSPDGSLVATGSDDDTARVWSADGDLLATLRGHSGSVVSIRFSPDGSEILTGSRDGTARLWDARSGTLLVTLAGHTGSLNVAEFDPSGARVVTASTDRTARLWDVRSPLVGTIVGQVRAISRDGSRIVNHQGDLWSASGVRIADVSPLARFRSAAFSSDGSRLFVISATESGLDLVGSVWDAATGALIRDLPEQESDRVAISPDGTRLLADNQDGTSSLLDTSDGRVLRTFAGGENFVSTVGFSPDGSRIAISFDSVSSTALWELDGAQPTTLPGVFRQFSPDGSRILTSTGQLWSLDGRVVATFPGTEVQFSADGTRLLHVGRPGSVGTGEVWDATRGVRLSTVGKGDAFEGARISPDGSRVVSTGNGFVDVWDAESGALLMTLVHSSDIFTRGTSGSAIVSPDSSRIVTSGFDGNVKLWSSSGSLLATFEAGLVGRGKYLDGSRLITEGTLAQEVGGSDFTVTVWEVLSLPEAIEAVERSLGDRKLTEGDCLLFEIDPCPR